MSAPQHHKPVIVVGAGIFGLWQALTLARAGYRVKVAEISVTPFENASSRWAGAMIAPECEAEGAPDIVRDLGRRSLQIWRETYPGLRLAGTLVVAAPRDRPELTRFQRMTERHQLLHAGKLAELEPQLGDRFDCALYYPDEAHMDAISALHWLLDACRAAGVEVLFGQSWTYGGGEMVIDCRGIAARGDVKALRGVRGERIVLFSKDVQFSRPVRLLHPRQPIYVVPQGDGRYVVGATVIEREDDGPVTVKSALDLLGAAYAIHPGFAEADIIDGGAGLRPSFADNVPCIHVEDEGQMIRVNGAYRHGFLCAPALAEDVVGFIATGAKTAVFS